MKGKCKEEFEKWLDNWWNKQMKPQDKEFWVEFIKLPLSLQWGVYLEFFDSVGMEDIHVFPVYISRGHGIGSEPKLDCYCYHVNGSNLTDEFNTRKEAQQAAIEKAVEIFNQIEN